MDVLYFQDICHGFSVRSDGGASWQEVVFQDAADPASALYLGTKRGLYRRDPNSSQWSKIVEFSSLAFS